MKKLQFLLFLLIPLQNYAQEIYTVDISKTNAPLISGHLKLGTNTNEYGGFLNANSLYFIKNKKPWYPVMGEFHFSRYPRQKWEESILKMKGAGIDVIATYIFWIYHEEEEGKFNWEGDNDLKAFAALCKKHEVFLFARIGPWCHGEVRNGGFPDWIVKRGNMRKNNSEYLASVEKFFNETGSQLKGLYFKDGGPVIGAQIENEYRFNNPAGLEHILTLKKLAIKAGIDVPFYTATGWPGSNQKQDELVPVWGAYPEAPWDKKTTPLKLSENYLFGTLRNDPAIGSDLFGKQDEIRDYKGYRYPYATAEMGGGNQITYHRRPIITSDDVTALAYTKVGSGANLMGYYMFHGGSNPIGKLSTLQESKATNYPNDYPIISYDFQSPIGEWGQLRPSYRDFKVLHSFLNDFGDRLVNYYPSFPDKKPEGPADTTTLRFSVRSQDNSGFVFISNVQRQKQMSDIENLQFNLKLPNSQSFVFPENPVTVKKNVQAVLPFNMNVEGVILKYAIAQPLCIVNGSTPLYVFFAPNGMTPEYVFDTKGVNSLTAAGAEVNKKDSTFKVQRLKAGTNCITEIVLNNGKKVRILTLSHEQARNAYKSKVLGIERLFISEHDLIFPKGNIELQSTGNNVMKFSVYPDVSTVKVPEKVKLEKEKDGIFTSYTVTSSKKDLIADFKELADVSAFYNQRKQLPSDDRNNKNTPVSPGPQYQTNLEPVKNARYFEISIPEKALEDQYDAFLFIDYFGDTGSVYLDGKLIADDFYSGLTMPLALKRFQSRLKGKKLLFQIVPLTDEREIFFEKGIRDSMKGKEAADLNRVQIMPQYRVLLKVN